MSATGRPTVAHCLAEGAARLRAAGIDEPRREARLLLAHLLGDPARVIGCPEAPVANPDAYFDLVARRARREPFAYIVGRRGFWTFELEVGPAVLSPRPESELLVEAALEAVEPSRAEIRIADLGTGSGCLLLAVLAERPRARGIGVDISAAAIAIAARNAVRLGLDRRAAFAVGDWGAPLVGGFDLVLVNPPYVRSDEIGGLEPEIARFEPRTALDGGSDGLAAYRAVAPEIVRLLAPGGVAAVEIGAGQKADVVRIFARHGLHIAGVRCDLAGLERCLVCHT